MQLLTPLINTCIFWFIHAFKLNWYLLWFFWPIKSKHNVQTNIILIISLFPGAFLIPFMIMLILEGIPLFLIELGIGQKMRLGSLGVWNTIHPWLGGIGISSCIVTLFVALYYNVIITWCFFYLFNSFRVRFIVNNFVDYQFQIIFHCNF